LLSQTTSILFLFLLLTLASVAFGQPDTLWTRYYDRDVWEAPHSIVSTQDGAVIIGGSVGSSYSERTFWLFKADSLGNMLWEYKYQSTTLIFSKASINDVLLLEDGRLLLSGYAYPEPDDESDIRIIMTDDSGIALWEKLIGTPAQGEFVKDSEHTLDGGFIFTGGQGYWLDNVLLLLKTDSLGNVEWESTFDINENDFGYSVHQTSDGGFIVGALTTFPSGDYNCCVLKTDSAGELEWQSIFDFGFGMSFVRDIHETADGGFIGITGESSTFDTVVFKLDSIGNNLWDSRLNEGQTVEFLETSDGGHIHTGWTFNRHNNEIFLMKTDSFGNVIWDTLIDNWEYVNVAIYDICPTFDGGYFVSSLAQMEPATGDTWLLRFGVSTSINEDLSQEGAGLSCSCLPNPFTSSATVYYSLQYPSNVDISVFDLSGHMVDSWDISQQSCGFHSFSWIPDNTLPTGCYTVVVEACGMRTTELCIRIR
jgi:hypothetical protein